MPEVIVTVKPDGEVKVHAEGILGPACSLHTKPFIDALGVRAGEEALPELFMTETDKLYQDTGGEG